MRRATVSAAVILLLLSAPHSAKPDIHPCGSLSEPNKPWKYGDAVLFRAKVLNVDADGAPTSYLVNGKGLSYTCDGVVALENGKRITPDSNPNDWQQQCDAAWKKAIANDDYRGVAIFGFQTDKRNKPLIQAEGDPVPEKGYISATSVTIPGTPDGTQRHYVDALKIPYVVLPSSFTSKYQVKPGAIAVVYRIKTKKYTFGVFADGGGLGEASVKLHQNLGGAPIVKIKGVERAKSRIEDPVLIAVFPGAIAPPTENAEAWNREIESKGAAALTTFGGLEQLVHCAK